MKTTITMMERWLITTILHDKEFGDDDDMKTATMMLVLMLMLMMLMLMMFIFLCGCEGKIDLSPDLRHNIRNGSLPRSPVLADDKPRDNG